MRNKIFDSAKDAKLNQFLSAFLVIAYVICMYFISSWISTITNGTWKLLAAAAVYVVFGLLLFYATRVGEGRQIRRFSLSVLLLMVVPGVYILLASLATGLPLSSEIRGSAILQVLGYIMMGYGIPYAFFSGYESVLPKTEEAELTTFDLNSFESAEDEAEEAYDELEEEEERKNDPFSSTGANALTDKQKESQE